MAGTKHWTAPGWLVYVWPRLTTQTTPGWANWYVIHVLPNSILCYCVDDISGNGIHQVNIIRADRGFCQLDRLWRTRYGSSDTKLITYVALDAPSPNLGLRDQPLVHSSGKRRISCTVAETAPTAKHARPILAERK